VGLCLSAVCTRCLGGQSSDPGELSYGPECLVTAVCLDGARVESSTLTLEQPQPPPLNRSECVGVNVFLSDKTVSGTACACESNDGKIVVGPKGAGCAAVGRLGECLSNNQDFSGCRVGAADSCASACQALQTARQENAAKVYDVEILYANCSAGLCDRVLRIDGKCYANGSHVRGQAYDCTLSPEAIVAAERAARKPAEQSVILSGQSRYLAGTNGFVELSTGRQYFGTQLASHSFSVAAQFFQASSSTQPFGSVDLPAGVDDCNVSKPGSPGVGASPQLLPVASLTLEEDRSHPVSQLSSGNPVVPFPSYGLDLAAAGSLPRHGAIYPVHGGGGGLSGVFHLNAPQLPHDLVVPELARKNRFERRDLSLTWTGYLETVWEASEPGSVALVLRLSVADKLGDTANTTEVLCLIKDDGQFTIPAAILQQVPDGFARFSVSREVRSLGRSGGLAIQAIGSVRAEHAVALGPKCDRAVVAEACAAYAQAATAAYVACGQAPPPSAQLCPDYLAEACQGCPEYFQCLASNLKCENGQLSFQSGCSCP
jgi:hypothetical protein